MDNFEAGIQGQQPEKKRIQKTQVNFRAPDDLATWIKERSKALNQTQEDLLNHVVEEYMLRVKEEQFPSRGVETAEFQSYISVLNRMFVASLGLCQNTENRVREEFRQQIETVERTIADYQGQVTALKEERRSLLENANKTEALQRDLDAAWARGSEVEFDAKQRMDDLSTTNDSLMGDRKRLEDEIRKYREQIVSMTTAVNSYEERKRKGTLPWKESKMYAEAHRRPRDRR